MLAFALLLFEPQSKLVGGVIDIDDFEGQEGVPLEVVLSGGDPRLTVFPEGDVSRTFGRERSDVEGVNVSATAEGDV